MPLFILLGLLTISSSNAQDTFTREVVAVVRNEHFKGVITPVTVTHLLSPDCFQGKFFKIVKGKSEEVVCNHDDEVTRLKAATVYHHLSIARDYFVRNLKSNYVVTLPQLTIRVDITNPFNELGHFGNDVKAPEYNNALSIPAGKGFESRGIAPWAMEIWFRPMKRTHISEFGVRNNNQSFGYLLHAFRNQAHMGNLQRFLGQVLNSSINSTNFSWEQTVRMAGVSLFIELIYQTGDPINKMLSRKWYWLDSALVPEIIYHEFSHIALSDHLQLSHSTAVIEGMADYYAGVVANHPKLATRIKKYNTFSGKNAKRKQLYSVQFESTEYANADFVFGLLWELRKVLGAEKANLFIYKLREKIDTNATIRKQLLEGILSTCRELCDEPTIDRLRLLSLFNRRGI